MNYELVLVEKAALLDEIKKEMCKWIRSQQSNFHADFVVTEWN